MSDAIVLALIAIISGGGATMGGYLLRRIGKLEVKLEELNEENGALSSENAALKSEKSLWEIERARLSGLITELQDRVSHLEARRTRRKTPAVPA